VPFGYRFKGRWLQGTMCNDCGIIFIDPQPTTGEILTMYGQEYFEGDFRCGHAGSYFKESDREHIVDTRLLQAIKSHAPEGKFLEIGCAGGAFLNAARAYGYDVYGVELSEKLALFARQKYGLNVVAGDLTEASFPDSSFAVVFLGDVIEHLPDPRKTLRIIHRLMAHGGLLVILCPSQTNTLFSRFGFFTYRVTGRTAEVKLPPYHLFEYRPGSIATLLHLTGFAVTQLTEGMIPPREVALRGSRLQQLGKKMFQYPNALLTSLVGSFGDRIEVLATKQNTSA
jgi:SAM-dependent methyltransferase